MAKFEYSARTKQGKKESGVVDVPSEDDLVLRLQTQGLIVTRVVPFDKKTPFSAESSQSSSSSRKRKFRRGGVKLYDLVFFSRQLATLLDSGVTIHKALSAFLKQADSLQLYEIVRQAKDDVEGGLTLKEALAKHPKVFSDLWVHLIESGEASGNLPLVLDRLAQFLEMQANFRRKIVSALIYPIILFVVAIGAMVFFIIKIVPTFSGIFLTLGAELPLITRILIQVSHIVRKGFLPVLGILGLFYFLFRQFIKTHSGKHTLDIFKLRLPIFGNFFKVLAVERFTSEMATMIEGGVPILYALEISERSVGNTVLEGIISDVKTNVREGKPLSELMEKTDFFEPMVIQMIAVGEEVGELAKMFKRVSQFYDEYLETFVGRFATIFEPVMLVFMGGIIGVMVVALFMPIFSVVQVR